jgi:hypothetical protein
MTRHGLCFAILIFALQLPLGTSVARADVGATQATDEVNFPISCNAASQKAFNRAVWTLHSFWYPRAKGIYGHCDRGAGLRDGLLGHGDESLVSALVSAERGSPKGGFRCGREGTGRGAEDRA